MSDPAHPLTLWLARASMAFYAIAVLISASRRDSSPKKFKQWQAAWSAACLLLIAHVVAAFHFEHHWSHITALQHTAEQTAQVTGINWGGGLYFNYAFLVLWLVDVAFLWRVSEHSHSMLHRVTSLACLFMVVNATVVFGPGWWFWPVAAVGLAAAVIYQWSHRETQARDNDVSDQSPES
jgi:hypothetical protein